MPARAPSQEPAEEALDGSADSSGWAAEVGSPSPSTEQQRTSLLAKQCPDIDGNVARAAEALVQRSDLTVDSDEMNYVLRANGAPYVWPKLWSLEGPTLTEAEAAEHFARWFGKMKFDGRPRCGVAFATTEGGTRRAVALLADVLGELDPLPTRVRTGAWLTVTAHMFVETSEAKLVVLPPKGLPRTWSLSMDGHGRLRKNFRLDQPGRWLVQVLPTIVTGPRPVLEAVIFAGEAPTPFQSQVVPGESAAQDKPPLEAMYAMLAAARHSEKRGKLERDAALERAAQAHAEAMQAARKLAHDIGQGGPRERLEKLDIRPRTVGENVVHASSPARAHRALWASPSHRGNMLQAAFTRVGIGLARDPDGQVWVCQIFGDSGGARISQN